MKKLIVALPIVLFSANVMAADIGSELVGHAADNFAEANKELIDEIEDSTAGKIAGVGYAVYTGKASTSIEGVDVRYDNGDVSVGDHVVINDGDNVEIDVGASVSLTEGTINIGPGVTIQNDDEDGVRITATDVQVVDNGEGYSLNPIVIVGRELFGKRTVLDVAGINLRVGVFSNLFK